MNFYKDYINSIKTQKLVLVNPEGYLPPGVKGAPENVKPLILAPLNTDIRYNNKYNFKKSNKENFTLSLPKTWNWKDSFPIDITIKNMKEKKKLIEKPRNQMFCGSCWAMSTASSISDKFVATGLVKYSPNLSSTFILSLKETSQLKCEGGNILILHKSLEKTGLATSRCIDYSWCEENRYCNADKNGEEKNGGKEGGKEFRTPKQLISYLNSIIPENGCYYPENKDLYMIQDVKTFTNHNSDQEIQNFIYETKLHIFDYGSICAGFVVFMNFLSGNFGITNNIYIENIDYINSDPENIVTYEDFNPVGGHAVSVIGWGEEYVKCIGLVKYWYCRNTWGEKWGSDSGYFKYAAYPINKHSRLDISFDDIGGFIFCKPYKIIEDKVFNDLDEKNVKQIKKRYYKLEYGEEGELNSKSLEKVYSTKLNNIVYEKGEIEKKGEKSVRNVSKYYLLVFVLVFLIILFYIFNNKKCKTN